MSAFLRSAAPILARAALLLGAGRAAPASAEPSLPKPILARITVLSIVLLGRDVSYQAVRSGEGPYIGQNGPFVQC